MQDTIAGLAAGVIFGLGLCLSGLADPSVVLGFLDLAGAWNPTLLFVMGAGLAVTLIGYRVAFGQGQPLWSPRFNIPAGSAIDAPLLAGAAIFGLGWGLSGYCPGPAVVSLVSGSKEVFAFAAAMVIGMIAVRWLRARPSPVPKAAEQS